MQNEELIAKKHAELQNRQAKNKINPHLQNQQTLIFHRWSFVWDQQSGTELTLGGAKELSGEIVPYFGEFVTRTEIVRETVLKILTYSLHICTFLLVSLFISLFTKSLTLNNYTICKHAHTQQQF